MTYWNRRRALQAGLAAGGVLLGRAWAQGDRTLQVAPRPPSVIAAASLSASVLTAPRRALVIGNSSYAVGPLKNPANDAKAVAESLRAQGFEVALGLDLKRDEMLKVIAEYGEALARTKPVALFYFAGHGLQLAWRNYLVPVDAAIKSAQDVQARCVDVNAVIERIGKAANPMNVIVLDACRDDPFGNSQQKGLSQLDAPPGTLLAFATSPGNVASDGDGANGLYTENLLREMKVPEAKIEDVFKRVRLGVRRRSNGQQIPWESTSLEEDFWFIPPKETLRLAQEEAERLRQVREAERLGKEAERARQEELARQRLEQIEKAREQERERQFHAEVELWDKADGAKAAGPLEDYLRRYPSGRFAELAQLQLDALLKLEGEKPVQIVSATGNPFTQGSARADVDYKVGDSYTYVRFDRDTKEEQGRATTRVTEVTHAHIIFNDGRLIYDRLGNVVKLPNGDRFSPRQDMPLEYAIGKKWTTRYSLRNEDKLKSSEAEFEFRIARREKITVPAGTFDCFVIEGEGRALGRTGMQVKLGLKRWMAPDKCRRPIVLEQFRQYEGKIGQGSRGGLGKAGMVAQNERLELLAFKQS